MLPMAAINTPLCSNKHVLRKFNTAKRRTTDTGRWVSGENLFCNKCRDRIKYTHGYYTCSSDQCDYDVCTKCFNLYSNLKSVSHLKCSHGHNVTLRDPGFAKQRKNRYGHVYYNANISSIRCNVCAGIVDPRKT